MRRYWNACVLLAAARGTPGLASATGNSGSSESSAWSSSAHAASPGLFLSFLGLGRVLIRRARVGAHRALCLRRSEKSSKILAGSAFLLPSLPFPSRPVRDMKMRASELQQAPGPAAASASVTAVPTHKVTVHDRQRGVVHEFVVPQDQYILHTAEAQDIRLPFACRHGCCTSCAVRIKSGQIRQPEALGISAELKDKGYALLCVGFPSSDVEAETQDEDEVYWLQFGRYFARGPVERDDYALELAMGDE